MTRDDDEDSGMITLAEWAKEIGRTPEHIAIRWRPARDFPRPVGRRRRPTGRGPGEAVYDRRALETWLAAWEKARARPRRRYEVPGDPDEMRTLNAIARLLGIAGKSISQYRQTFDAHAARREHGARTLYRTGDVVNLLNDRPGAGVASATESDARRGRDLTDQEAARLQAAATPGEWAEIARDLLADGASRPSIGRAVGLTGNAVEQRLRDHDHM
ncbi:hypothetical protein C1I98_01415 [Spongiactinospora gelatinilytica]|uniref:Uncharacterized protein n=1 Tax=Spongiactinospora gelatinilytica TaxID=2666298 RepID=A0A2W2I2N7_9ACTN|nr:hypothetical protein [Spongiactinospora gelatinilytica]PZG56318.1 hypothetical protein C1I98_01415 [Spongiactinospora gelatinilytica]